MSDAIKPALTADEWAGREHGPRRSFIGTSEAQLWNDGILSYGFEYEVDRPHALAALALYKQPFGFTQEDVENLRAIPDSAGDPDGYGSINDGDWYLSLIARIAALLPPQEANNG